MQRQRRVQEKVETFVAYMQSLPFLDAFDGVERSLFDGTTRTMDTFWGSTGNVRFDAAPGIASMLPSTTARPHLQASGLPIERSREVS